MPNPPVMAAPSTTPAAPMARPITERVCWSKAGLDAVSSFGACIGDPSHKGRGYQASEPWHPGVMERAAPLRHPDRSVRRGDRPNPAPSSSRQPQLQLLLERDRVVVLGVLGAEDQGDVASFGPPDQLLERARTLLEFPGVTLPELVPFLRVVPEPFPEAGARRQILEPYVDPEVVLGDAPRPDAVDQNATAVALRGRFVGAFQTDRHGITPVRGRALSAACRDRAAAPAVWSPGGSRTRAAGFRARGGGRPGPGRVPTAPTPAGPRRSRAIPGARAIAVGR